MWIMAGLHLSFRLPRFSLPLALRASGAHVFIDKYSISGIEICLQPVMVSPPVIESDLTVIAFRENPELDAREDVDAK